MREGASVARLTDRMRQFLDEPRYGVLATINGDGSPQQTVMWFTREGDTIMMNTLRGRKKDRNIARDGRASLCVEEGTTYLTLSGTIAFEGDVEQGRADIAKLARRYVGPDAGAEFAGQERVTLRLTVDKVDAHGFEDEG